MNSKKKKAGVVITVVNFCVILLCVILILLMLVPMAYSMVSKDGKMIFGRYLYVNTNDNLEPVMAQNDIITVIPTPLAELAQGDFLCYYPVGQQDAGVVFGKIMSIEGDLISLTDKQGHTVDMSIGEIVPIGKATDKILLVGQLVHFLKDGTNRTIFYLILGVLAAGLICLVIVLHLKQQKINKQAAAAVPPPRRYTLDDFVELETEPIEFEIAPKHNTEIHS